MPNTAVLDAVVSGEDFGAQTPEAPSTSETSQAVETPATQAPPQQAPAQAPQPAPAQAPQQSPAEPAEIVQNNQRFVPHAALHAEREANRQLKARLAELEGRQSQPARLTPQELLEIQRQMQPQQPTQQAPTPEPEPAVPNFLENPKGYIDATLGKTAKELADLKQANARLTEQQQQAAQEHNVRTVAQYAETEFVKKTPDYYAALDYGRTARLSQLKMIYPQAPDVQLRQAVAREELALAAHAIQSGRNPAEVAYGYIQSMGYRPTAAAQAQTPATPAQPTPAMLAAQTLGASSAAEPTTGPSNEPEDPNSEVKAALAEMFGVRRK